MSELETVTKLEEPNTFLFIYYSENFKILRNS